MSESAADAPPNPAGRPTAYRAAFAKQAEKLCLLGATDEDMADFFEVSVTTINTWKHAHPRFLASVKKGKLAADGEVAASLYRRATGYEHQAVKIITVPRGNNQGSDVEQVPYTERYPPETLAGIFWLKNRRPDLWRDRHALEHTGADGGPVVVDDARTRLPTDPAERLAAFGTLMAGAVAASPALREQLTALAPLTPEPT